MYSGKEAKEQWNPNSYTCTLFTIYNRFTTFTLHIYEGQNQYALDIMMSGGIKICKFLSRKHDTQTYLNSDLNIGIAESVLDHILHFLGGLAQLIIRHIWLSWNITGNLAWVQKFLIKQIMKHSRRWRIHKKFHVCRSHAQLKVTANQPIGKHKAPGAFSYATFIAAWTPSVNAVTKYEGIVVDVTILRTFPNIPVWDYHVIVPVGGHSIWHHGTHRRTEKRGKGLLFGMVWWSPETPQKGWIFYEKGVLLCR